MSITANINPDVRRSHDFRNAVHTAILIAGTALLAGGIAYVVFGVEGLVYAGVSSAIGLYLLSRVSPGMVLTLYKARRLTRAEMPELHDLVEELAANAQLPAKPQLYYVQSKMLNAFAVGRREDSAIAVTDGLLRAMTLRQLGGILAHEISHIRSGDLRVMGLADVLNRITGFMSTMGLIGVPLMFGTGWNIPVLGLLLLIFAPTVGGLLQLALSRAREYDADLDGAALTGDPEGLASALALLERRQGAVWEGLVFPGSRLPEPSLLRTHPRTEDRIKKLLALRRDTSRPVNVSTARAVPGPSVVPVIRDPRIHWQRLGIWY
jgi:heat shock protein HtpX